MKVVLTSSAILAILALAGILIAKINHWSSVSFFGLAALVSIAVLVVSVCMRFAKQ